MPALPRSVLVTALATPLLAAVSLLPAQQINDHMLVSTSWLADHLDDPSVVIIHVGNPDTYEAGHIPGARLLSYDDFTVRRPPLYTELPGVEALREVLERSGVSDDSHLVLYHTRGYPTMVGRLFVTLEYLGVENRISVLDGGLTTWDAEGRPTEQSAPAVLRGTLTVHPRSDVVVDRDWVREHYRDTAVRVLDARTPQFYTGAAGVTMHAFRPGHIPGAGNLPFTSLTDDSGRFKSPHELHTMFVESDATPNKRVVTYCHLGQQASLLYFVARYLGYDASMYDGSFEDWSADETLPVVEGSDEQ